MPLIEHKSNVLQLKGRRKGEKRREEVSMAMGGKTVTVCEKRDHISYLPGGILHAIFARIPTRAMVACRVLSKKFNHLLSDSELKSWLPYTSQITARSHPSCTTPAFLVHIECTGYDDSNVFCYASRFIMCDVHGKLYKDDAIFNRKITLLAACGHSGLYWVLSFAEPMSFVYNPLSRSRIEVEIPQELNPLVHSCGISYDPFTSTCTLLMLELGASRAQIYSSETGQWKELHFPFDVDFARPNMVSTRACFYWLYGDESTLEARIARVRIADSTFSSFSLPCSYPQSASPFDVAGFLNIGGSVLLGHMRTGSFRKLIEKTDGSIDWELYDHTIKGDYGIARKKDKIWRCSWNDDRTPQFTIWTEEAGTFNRRLTRSRAVPKPKRKVVFRLTGSEIRQMLGLKEEYCKVHKWYTNCEYWNAENDIISWPWLHNDDSIRC